MFLTAEGESGNRPGGKQSKYGINQYGQNCYLYGKAYCSQRVPISDSIAEYLPSAGKSSVHYINQR